MRRNGIENILKIIKILYILARLRTVEIFFFLNCMLLCVIWICDCDLLGYEMHKHANWFQVSAFIIHTTHTLRTHNHTSHSTFYMCMCRLMTESYYSTSLSKQQKLLTERKYRNLKYLNLKRCTGMCLFFLVSDEQFLSFFHIIFDAPVLLLASTFTVFQMFFFTVNFEEFIVCMYDETNYDVTKLMVESVKKSTNQ